MLLSPGQPRPDEPEGADPVSFRHEIRHASEGVASINRDYEFSLRLTGALMSVWDGWMHYG